MKDYNEYMKAVNNEYNEKPEAAVTVHKEEKMEESSYTEAKTIEYKTAEPRPIAAEPILPASNDSYIRYEVKTKPKKTNQYTKRVAVAAVGLALLGGTFGAGYGTAVGVSNYLNSKATQQAAALLTESSASDESDIHNFVNTSQATLSDGSSVISIFKAVSDSVVSINVKGTAAVFGNRKIESEGAGSGIIFREDTEKLYIVTNYHVVSGATAATISIDDTVQVSASFVGGDSVNDIAVISVNKSDMIVAGITQYGIASFGDSDKIEIGQTAVAIGNALGEGKSATAGIISAINKEIDIEGQILSVIQTDAAINPGNSGGALVDANAQVIGINTAKISSTYGEGMGYAIPSNVVKELINSIMANPEGTPYIGIQPASITEAIKDAYNFPALGVYVQDVIDGTGAAVAGLKRGDIITAANGRPITSREELTEIVTSMKVGDTIQLTVIRDFTTTETINVVLSEYKSLNF